MQHIQLLFKLLFELLDGKSGLYLKKWHIDEYNVIYIILVRTNKVGSTFHTAYLRLSDPHPETAIDNVIDSCKEFIDGEGKEAANDSNATNRR